MDSAVDPSSAMERARKVQEVILRAVDGCLKWDSSRRDPRDLGLADAAVETAVRARRR